MKSIYKGIILGLIFGIIDVLLMIPLPLQDKPVAILSAFCGRFAIGFLVPLLNLPIASWQKGLLLGTMLSLPDAIITQAFGPIMITGIIGGIFMGVLADKIKL